MMALPRLPTISDFPKGVTFSSLPSRDGKPPCNLLILLHGFGGNEEPFVALGTKFNLPATACISIRAPRTVPFNELGFHWGDDIIFDSASGGLDMDSGFEGARKLLDQIIEDTLLKKCGWRRRSIFFFGFGQGGMVAMDIAARLLAEGGEPEYGGVVSVGGPLPDTARAPPAKAKTPAILLGGAKNSAVTTAMESRLRFIFESVTVVLWGDRSGDGMMRNAEETFPVMRFFASRLGTQDGML